MKLKPLRDTTEAETSVCLFKTGGPSTLGTPEKKKKSIYFSSTTRIV